MKNNGYEKRYVTYEEFGEMATQLVEQLKGERFTRIYGPPRGGLPLAVHLSHFLDIDLITSDEIITNMNKWRADDRLLVTDDVVRHGHTIQEFTRTLAIRKIDHFTATLFYRPNEVYEPDLFVTTTDKWIVFPWERPEEPPNH